MKEWIVRTKGFGNGMAKVRETKKGNIYVRYGIGQNGLFQPITEKGIYRKWEKTKCILHWNGEEIDCLIFGGNEWIILEEKEVKA